MTITHFSVGAGNLTYDISSTKEGLRKKALILVEGEHKDNKGVLHQFSRQRIQKIADNTNGALSQGAELPLLIEHAKQIIDSNGQLRKLGESAKNVECRVIFENDLPNPKMSHLVGKLGLFGEFNIRDRIQEVSKGLLKSLSPGLDLQSERLVEVSVVSHPAILGPALFSAFSYKEVKQQADAYKELKQGIDKNIDILLAVFQSIDKQPEQEIVGWNPGALKRSAIEDFTADLYELAGISRDTTDYQEPQKQLDPYGNLQQYSQQEPQEKPTFNLKKRRRKR